MPQCSGNQSARPLYIPASMQFGHADAAQSTTMTTKVHAAGHRDRASPCHATTPRRASLSNIHSLQFLAVTTKYAVPLGYCNTNNFSKENYEPYAATALSCR